MNFSEALKAMKMGSKVSREAWRGKIAHWCINTSLVANKISKGPIPIKSIREYLPAERSGKIVDEVKTEDLFAEDWWIVVSDGMGKVHDIVSDNLPEIGG